MNDDKDKMQKRMHRMRPKRKICAFCVDKSKSIDYKDTLKLKRFLTERGKIQPRRTSGVCAKHQRELAIAIKRARVMAMLPFSQD
jgi:small subunit ribosomal protein S18